MDNIKRLTSLLEGTKFKSTPDWSSNYPLMNLGKHNLAEFDKLGNERNERIAILISASMADVFQPLALEQLGHTDDSAIRTVLYDKMFPNDEVEELNSLGQQLRKEALGDGFSETQADMMYQWLVSCFPTWLVACIAELINRWQLLPRVTVQRTAAILATMFSEVANVDTVRHN